VAYYYSTSGSGWGAGTLLAASDAFAEDLLGTAVGLGSETVLAGSPGDNDAASDAGVVIVFGDVIVEPTPDPDPSPTPDPTEEPQACVSEEQTTEEVFPGVTLTWDSGLRCNDAPDTGTYEFSVMVEADSANTALAVLDGISLTHTTPRPLGVAPEASLDTVVGLPADLAASGVMTFTVSGAYELAMPGAARLANLHFCAQGHDDATGEPFYMGLNAFLRGTGSDPEDPTALLVAPNISNVTVLPRANSAIIGWQTNQPATSAVTLFPTDVPALLDEVNRGCLAVENHSIEVTGLMADTQYTFRVTSQTGLEAPTTSGDFTFSTSDNLLLYLPTVNH
jgi:hypothetical protein